MFQHNELKQIIDERQLYAFFQPIAAFHKNRIYGYEGLIRGPSDSLLHSPVHLFATAEQENELARLDHVCREVIINRFLELELDGYLFINIMPGTVLDTSFQPGQTLDYLHASGLSPDRVVIELTEQHPVTNYEAMRKAMEHYRSMGFSIALDDLGAGNSGLRQWSELRPDFVKIDRHFIWGINSDPGKREFVRSILDMATTLGSEVIAEGIETLEEFRTLWTMNIKLGQGYYLGRPASRPPVALACPLPSRHSNQDRQTTFRETISDLANPVPPIEPATRVNDVVAMFDQNTGLRLLAVVEDGKPIGLVRKQDLVTLYASRYGRELFSKKPITRVLRSDYLCASADMSIDQLSQLITKNNIYSGDDGFIVVDESGNYIGVGTLSDLLKQITDLKLQYARYANPLTGLAGNVPINRHIDELLGNNRSFVAAYCDLDNFKPYNDVYGYARGDDLIIATANLIREQILPIDFVGHVGGDDFVIIFQDEYWQDTCNKLLGMFEQQVLWFYNEGDRKAGGIQSPDRQGRLKFYPIASISIGAVKVEPDLYSNHQEISDQMAAVKQQAKKITGNSLFIDRRNQCSHQLQQTLNFDAIGQ